VLAAVASAIAAQVTGNPQTCRVLMEATTLAAYEPAIATKVQAANAASLDQLTGLFQAGIAAGQWPAGTDPALRAAVHRGPVRADVPVAPGARLVRPGRRDGALAGADRAGPGDHRGDPGKKGDGT
jgi:hypothetical protein